MGQPVPNSDGRDARLEEDGAAGAGTGLREPLCRHDPERDAEVDEVGRQAGDDLVGPGVARLEALGLDRREALLDRAVGGAVEEVGGVHGVPGPAERVGQGVDAGRQALDVVEEDDLGHAGDSNDREFSIDR